MTEYGIRLDNGHVIVGPGWTCEADVLGTAHGRDGEGVQGTVLVRRDTDTAPWVEVH